MKSKKKPKAKAKKKPPKNEMLLLQRKINQTLKRLLDKLKFDPRTD